MYEILDYDVHGFLRFRIRRKGRLDIMRDLNLMFGGMQVEKVEDPDIVLNIGQFVPSNQNCQIVDHKYYVKKNYFYCKDASKSARWEVEILGMEDGQTTVNFNSRIIGPHCLLLPDILPQNFLLRPLLEYRLRENGCLLIQAAAVSKGDHAYLLVGRGGAGKTTLVMDLVRRAGFDFISDELIIINHNRVFSFPTHLIEFDFRISHLLEEYPRNWWDKIKLEQHLWRNRDYPNRVEIPVKNDVPLRAMCFLVRRNRDDLNTRYDLEYDNIVRKLVANTKLEWSTTSLNIGLTIGGSNKYMLAYSFAFPESGIARYWSSIEADYRKAFKDIACCQIEWPDKYSPELANQVAGVWERMG
jgi:hypothetical protein